MTEPKLFKTNNNYIKPIYQILFSIGAPTKRIGYKYSIFMINAVAMDKNNLKLLTKNLYPKTARRFNTTCASVESALRRLSYECWKNGNVYYMQIFGQDRKKPPTNLIFLSKIAQQTREFRGGSYEED